MKVASLTGITVPIHLSSEEVEKIERRKVVEEAGMLVGGKKPKRPGMGLNAEGRTICFSFVEGFSMPCCRLGVLMGPFAGCRMGFGCS